MAHQRWGPFVGAATLGLARKFIDPRILDSVDQAETYDESAENLTGGWFDRTLNTTSGP
jgi:hypothetical protein